MAFVMELLRGRGVALLVGFALGFIANEWVSQATQGTVTQVATPKDDCFREAAKNPTERGVDLAAALCMKKFGNLSTP